MANGVLSSYFETDRAKAAKKAGGGVSAYSAPVDTGGAPVGGGGAAPSAPAAAPKGSASGGTGFVSFGQYFGANAPAIQAQAQKTVEQAKGAAPSGMGQFAGTRPSLTGQSVGSMARQFTQPRQTDPFARQIAQTEKQSAGLEQAARYGDMGEGASAFDQLLGGGVTQRAAKQEQQRLGTLRAALEGEQAQYQKEQEQQARLARSREEAQRRQEERAARDAADVERAKDLAYDKVAGWVEKLGHSRESYWNSLSEEEQQAMMNGVAQERGYDQYGPEYASVSQ